MVEFALNPVEEQACEAGDGTAPSVEVGAVLSAGRLVYPVCGGNRIDAKIKFDCWSKDFYQAV